MRRELAVTIGLVLLGTAGTTQAGAFIFADNNDSSVITHPKNYLGSGGTITNTVCLNTSVLPDGVAAGDVEASIQKVIRSWNAGRASSRNLAAFGSNNDIDDFTQTDYESTLLHELGHCIGLGHPNLSTESGLSDPQRNATKAKVGDDAAFDTDAGTDALHGSSDDLRDDDVNLYWFDPDSNDPLSLPSIVDTSTFTQDTASLPAGHSWVANGDRSVLAALGYPNNESAMQQGATNDEVQRRPNHEDIATLRLGMAGANGLAGDSDDYALLLSYGGQVEDNTCDINVTFSAGTAFAACSTNGAFLNATHVRITSATVLMSSNTDWYYSQTENTATRIAGVAPASPALGESTTITVEVDRLSADMTGAPPGSFEAVLGTATCEGSLTASGSTGSGSCDLVPMTTGSQTLQVDYLGYEGFDASTTSSNVSVDKADASVEITSDAVDPSAVGAAYTVAVTVAGITGLAPSGTVTISDGDAACNITLSGGSGSCALTSTTAGSKTLTATYAGDDNYNGASDSEPHTVSGATPSVTITSDAPDPSVVGTSYTVEFTVSGGGVTPEGSVTIGDGDSSCNATLSSGSGSCVLVSTTAGSKTLTANYAGDANYDPASDTEPHTVSIAIPVVTITGDVPDPSVVGAAYAVDVDVTGAGVDPTGDVTISDGTDDCTATLAAGSGGCQLTSSTAGGKTLTASYAGDDNYAAGSDTDAHTVSTATPTVMITGDAPDPSPVGSGYTVEVSVSGPGVAATGNVTIDDGDNDCSASLTAGAGSCVLMSTTAGSKTLTASYAGDANYAAASDTDAHTVSTATPAVMITGDAPDPSPVGGGYTVDVSVSGAGVAATGSVTLSDGDNDCSASLTAGAGSCLLTSTTTGSKTLTASYSGDANYAAASATEAHTVSGAPPTVTITGDAPDPSIVGASYTVEFTVSGGGDTPTGNVAIGDGDSSCNATLSSGSGSCMLVSTTAGNRTLTADYSGDDNYDAASDTESHTVTVAAPIVTITGVAPEPSVVGTAYTVDVDVTGAGVDPSGNVTISDGTDDCTATLAMGSASCELTSATAGSKTLTASYAGDVNYAAASDTEAHSVDTATPTVTITGDAPDPSPVGSGYTVDVVVSGTGIAATGSVMISDGDNDCNASLTAGAGSCMLTSTTAGNKTLTATYAGDDNYNGASDTEPHSVSGAIPTVTITSDAPDPTTVGASYDVGFTVSGAGTTPTGSVTIDDGLDGCTGALVAGSGSCSLTSTTAGSKTLIATYAGNADYSQASDSEPHTVSKGTATLNITTDSPDGSTVGSAYTVDFSIAGNGVIPVGTVTVSDGSSNCSGELNDGTGSCELVSVTAGTKSLVASFEGDANYLPAADTEAHDVGVGSATVNITGDTPDPSRVGAAYLVSVAVAGGGIAPSGSVTVNDGDASCDAVLTAGIGSCELVSTVAGELTLTASYPGDSNYSSASGVAGHGVVRADDLIYRNGFEPAP